MLILSRRAGEKIIIGDREVEVVVISFDKGQVKLGFDADPKIRINREEVFIKIQNEQRQTEVEPELAECISDAEEADEADEDEEK